jgi:hypothetical protein
MSQQILPPEDPNEPIQPLDPDHLPPALAFTPVPRKTKPYAGINARRQCEFIVHLAGNGCVKMSAAAVGFSPNAFYQLAKAEGAESFAMAWDTAIDMGARRVRDTLMSHAIHGTPERLIKDGEVILERRKFNSRTMMWIVQQRLPEQYGGSLNLGGTPASALPHSIRKLKEQWRKEWEAERNSHAAEEETNAELLKRLKVLHKRNWYKQYVPWMDDAQKRAACELLYGAQDWDAIRAAHERAERNGRLSPEEAARIGYRGE